MVEHHIILSAMEIQVDAHTLERSEERGANRKEMVFVRNDMVNIMSRKELRFSMLLRRMSS
ncbi:hypothetical protein COT42_05780 [Candidatus Saganbacteria bacterium CG08_land_8_20_14_0_20_45_16]|uniref:Uncharacterized protein n=1 Tax=Candidatus Saganbacteria bacterium CG08_land_8_20_14_0_20_45_16 TaxID=2014293 RepID=A0A2H0XWJ6_UNCSA|nr:MAG: hypothetical protein COT42_05780 [Candidatus Saganbacteria bacterium CG08_land_8_20_14_0_20_45_16]